jgi:6-phosphogluconolactonase
MHDRQPGATVVNRFDTHAEACEALAVRVAGDLAAAIEDRGAASLAVPGGTTPAEFLAALARQSVDWPRVTVMLTDERWVPPDHPRSNTALVERTLGHPERRHRWYPLWRAGAVPEQAVMLLDAGMKDIPWPLDVAVLGMGEDGHVASLFPGDETGFAEHSSRFVAVSGPGDEPRVSLTARALAEAREAYLLLRGEAKLEVFRAAPAGGLPVARVLAARDGRLQVFVSD